MKIIKSFFIFFLAAALALSFTACQENPDGSIVVHKDMDNLISKAQETGPSKVEAGDIADEVAENYESYQTTLEDESLGVTVNVNAQVDVPEVETLSVYRVQQKPFTQEFVDKVRQVLMGDKAVYEATALTAPTKADYEATIQYYREQIQAEEAKMAAATEEDRTEGSQEDRYVISVEDFRANCQMNIDALQYELDLTQGFYENAPVSVDLSQYPIDGKLLTEGEHYSLYPEFYSFGPDCDEDETLYIAADSADGRYQTLKVRNSADRSNSLYYTSCPDQYLSPDFSAFTPLDPKAYGETLSNDTVPVDFLSAGLWYDETMEFAPFENDETTISEEEALSRAEAFLAEIGLTDFTLSEGGLFNQLISDVSLHIGQSGKFYYRHMYIFRFRREIGGVQLTQSSGAKFADSGSGEDYRKQYWPGEVVEVQVNDAGIAGFSYDAPVEITETVAESASLKLFSEVKDTFESMVCVMNAVEDTNLRAALDIDRVRLSYSRISERDSFDTGLIVPVWSFEGTQYLEHNNEIISETHGSQLAINAIDGSIIDGSLGY